ncbi:MAG: hypothetical protein DRR19_27370, partial [Candidatus Parabeggiatoa sp. nov. 1]
LALRSSAKAVARSLLKKSIKRNGGLPKRGTSKKPRKDKKQCPCTIKLGGKKRQGDRLLKKAGSKPKEDECVDLQLHSVRFLDDLTIHKDMVGRADPITGAEWENSSLKQFKNEPVGYAGGTQMRVEVKFKVIRPPKEKAVTGLIKGVTTVKKKDGSKIGIELLMKPGEKVTLPKGSTGLVGPLILRAKNNQKDIDWEKMTQFYNQMEIDWKFAPTTTPTDADFKPVDSSEHQVYVTLNKPLNPLNLKEGEVFLTVLHLATSNSGAKDDAEAVWNTWQLFAEIKNNPQNKYRSESLGPKGVKNWKGDPIFYYPEGLGLWDCSGTFEDFLIAKKNLVMLELGLIEEDKKNILYGSCGYMADLFRESLKVNHIDSQIIDATAEAESTDENAPGLILIKHWALPDDPERQSYPNEPEYKWYLHLHEDSMVSAIKTGEVGEDGLTYGDIKNVLNGLPGQHVETPSEKIFGNHGIVKVLLKEFQHRPYFDPSYGKTYIDERDFENKAVDGYANPLYKKDKKGKKIPHFYHYKVRRSEGLNNIHFELIEYY